MNFIKNNQFYLQHPDGTPMPIDSIELWARMMDHNSIAQDQIGDYLVSTVFLGKDHNFGVGGDPILWETMIFSEKLNEEYQQRYSSLKGALEGHKRAVKFAEGEE